MIRILRTSLSILAAFWLLLNANCAIMQWQRQYLGDPIMYFDKDGDETKLNNHIYPRREGSGGGYGGAGGGCGC